MQIYKKYVYLWGSNKVTITKKQITMSVRTKKEQEKKELDTLKALNQLYHTLKYTDKVSVGAIQKEHGLQNHFSCVLKEAKIMVSNGKHSKATRYEWASIKPNIHMAREVDKKIRDRQTLANNSAQKRRKPKSVSVVSNVKKPVKTNRVSPTIENNIVTNVKERKLLASETSYLFGLIKVKTKYFYKN